MRSRHGLLLVLMVVALAATEARSAGDPVLAQLAKLNRTQLQRAALSLAREAITQYVLRRRVIRPSKSLPAAFRRLRAGAFVTVIVKGRSRACMGAVAPTQSDLAREIIQAAVNAASDDPWHRPLRREELKDLEYTVSICGEPRRMHTLGELVADRDGLMVRLGIRGSVVLPGEAKTASYALHEARRKAGIKPGEHPEWWRFPVMRLTETHPSGRRGRA